jgi:hypothetical protein
MGDSKTAKLPGWEITDGSGNGLSFNAPMRVEKVSAPAHLRQAVNAANEAGFQLNGVRNTCLETSHALRAYLANRGHNATLVRSTFRHFPVEGWGANLGSSNRSSSGKGWAGHLTVECDGFLLDSTADQVNDSPTQTGERGTWVTPLILPLWERYEDGAYLFLEWADGSRGDYQRYYRQNGFSYQPVSRRIAWGETLELMVKIIESDRGEWMAGAA